MKIKTYPELTKRKRLWFSFHNRQLYLSAFWTKLFWNRHATVTLWQFLNLRIEIFTKSRPARTVQRPEVSNRTSEGMRWISKDWFLIKSTVSNNLNLPFRPVSILTFIDDVASITIEPIAIETGNLIIQLYLWSFMSHNLWLMNCPDQ